MNPAGQRYVDKLNAAWKVHRRKRKKGAPTVVSTFAGCGGSSLGYSMAGFRELLAVEWDEKQADIFRHNFPNVPIHQGDICDLTVEKALEMTGLEPGELDLLDGSPPCQGFSTLNTSSGRGAKHDERNDLFMEFGRLLSGLKPRVFVMENVPGMVGGKMKPMFVRILKDLKGRGYKVSVRKLKAMYFDVPQTRQRLIFVGVREDLDAEPSHPAATSNPLPISLAIEGRADVGPEPPPLTPRATQVWNTARPGQCGKDLDWTPRLNLFNTVKLDPHKVAPTIPRTQSGTGVLMHWLEPRSISIGEAMRVASFPDQFEFLGTFRQQWAAMGNCVPPMMMKAIADHVRKEILEK